MPLTAGSSPAADIKIFGPLVQLVERFSGRENIIGSSPIWVHPETILWTNDYTQPWTDKRFCEYFKITGYIDDEHAEPGSEWETILNEMKE